ncbi:hypothetical protein CHUAL_011487 [Chamberlinius hualienensis]
MASNSKIPKELHDSIRSVLGKSVKIGLKCPVKMETKGDKTENKVLVFTAFRCYVMAAKIPCKMDFNFHYLDIQAIDSKKPQQISFTVSDKMYTFNCVDCESNDADSVISHVVTLLRTLFPSVPLDSIIRRIDVVPSERIQFLLENNRHNSLSSMTNSASSSSSSSSLKKDVGPCGGFSKQYAAMCDYHGLPFREEVAWDVDTIYLSHDTKELSLRDFDHLEMRDLIPIISALEYNMWFTKFRASQLKLTSEVGEQILNVMKKNSSLEEIYLDNIGMRWEFAHKLSLALIANHRIPINTMDLSNNLIEDKGANHIAKAACKSPKGIVHLNLAKTGLTSKGVNTLIHALSINKFMPTSLSFLNLADNNLKDEVNNLYNFLAQPNALTHLDLSGTECSIDMLFGALLRGCCQKLSHINLSRNSFSHKKSKDAIVPPSFKQFFSTTIGLKYLNLSSTKIPTEALKNLMLGLVCNESASEVELELSCNALASHGAHVVETCVPEMRCLASLDLSDNGLDAELSNVLLAIGKNKSIRRLSIARNFTNAKAKHISQAMEALVQIIQEEECKLEYLSLADSRLKMDINNLINALGSNQCLVTVDISGNQMGDTGARLLAKALQINNRLRAVIYDRNNVTGQGFQDLAYAMESNYAVRYMPFPMHDAMVAMKSMPEKTEVALRKIENLLHRNVSPKKYSKGQAFRLQQGFLLSSTQQMVDKLVVQTQDTVNMLRQVTGSTYESTLEKATDCIHDANNSKTLLTRLHEVVLQKEETGNSVDKMLTNLSDELTSSIEQHLEGTVSSMIQCAEEQCPTILADKEAKEDLHQSCLEKSTLSKDFVKHSVVEVAGTDIINKVNELHLAAAAHISDRIVDLVVDSLTKAYKSLVSFSNNRNATTPEGPRLSRVRADSGSSKGESIYDGDSLSSPRATPQLASKRKTVHSRKLRPQSVADEDFVGELPGSEQKLEHLVKDRPKRLKTRAPTRPAVRNSEVITADQDLNEGLDNFFQKTDPISLVSSASQDNKSLPSLNSISETTPSNDMKWENSSSKESLVSKENRASPDAEPVKKDSFKEKNSRSFIKGLNSVFGRTGSQEKFQRSKSMEQTEQIKVEETIQATSAASPVVTVSATDSLVTSQVESTNRRPIAKLGMGVDVMAEMKALQEKRMSVKIPLAEVEEEAERVKEETSPKLKPETSPKYRPPPIAPKPRPRSTLSLTGRRSGDFSPLSEGSSGIGSPDGASGEIGSVDSGLVGSRDSIESKGSVIAEDELDVDFKQKASSLPRNTTTAASASAQSHEPKGIMETEL